ncbi:MAG: hypothetical protein IID15_04030, partial [Candidatus Marinimicrobia bacterium]|nr:hypothetical protein [Candidatus Neomarinimicrobiota bacterium]
MAHSSRAPRAFYLLLALWLVAVPAPAQVTSADSLALLALYNSTGGANWTKKTNWLTG